MVVIFAISPKPHHCHCRDDFSLTLIWKDSLLWEFWDWTKTEFAQDDHHSFPEDFAATSRESPALLQSAPNRFKMHHNAEDLVLVLLFVVGGSGCCGGADNGVYGVG